MCYCTCVFQISSSLLTDKIVYLFIWKLNFLYYKGTSQIWIFFKFNLKTSCYKFDFVSPIFYRLYLFIFYLIFIAFFSITTYISLYLPSPSNLHNVVHIHKSFFLLKVLRFINVSALSGVAQWIECLPVNQRIAGSIPSQGTSLGCRSGPW